MKLLKPILISLSIFLFLIIGALLTWYYLQGPAHQGLVRSDFADRPFKIEEIVDVTPVANKPNIVFILADDLGYGDVGYNLQTVINTKNLDAFASQSVVFTNFYAPASICTPSRIGFLSGRYALRQGLAYPFHHVNGSLVMNIGSRVANVLGAVDMRGEHNIINGIMPSELIIPELLKLANYRTGVVGKWHLGTISQDDQFHPFHHGFDYFVGLEASNDDWPVAFYDNDKKVLDDIGLNQAHYTQLFTDAAKTFIDQNKDEPFFLYLAHKDPHQPFFPSQGFKGKSKAGAYGDAVEEFDHSVGQVLDYLDSLGLTENTIVVITSDNGPWFEGNPCGLRGRKGQVFEGGYRVPFMIRYPKKIKSAYRTDIPAMGIDLLPTLVAEAGVSLPKDRIIDGRNLFDILADSSETGLGRNRPLFFFHDYAFEAVRMGDWKFIETNYSYTWPVPLEHPNYSTKEFVPTYSPPEKDTTINRLDNWPKLYNLKESPYEAYNLNTRNEQKGKDMQRVLTEFRNEFLKNPRGWREY
ncbi:MAG: sulfatase-like hydrolase/transferase [Flavobacteriales bacterium]|nr:sulfatase-like hydrolase/transferase [Flavobacteriales bacterium]